MSRGPQPKPTILKLIAGNPGKRELNADEPIPPEGSPVPPEWLNEDAVAIWNALVPPLTATKLFSAIDWPLVGRYCVKLARWIEIGKEIKRRSAGDPGSFGTTYPIYEKESEEKKPKGKKKNNAENKADKDSREIKYVAEFPWACEWRSLDRDLRADEARIGIGAAARSRISVAPEKEKSKDQARRDFFNPQKTGA